MAEITEIQNTLINSLQQHQRDDYPYPHWSLNNCLPEAVVDEMLNLPFMPSDIADTYGRRETNNDSRVHFGEKNRTQHPVMDKLSKVFQDPKTIETLQTITGAMLKGTSLRIEYCQDTGNFWLEPHTDIGVKKFTMLIYLNREPEALEWGTDLYLDKDTYLGRAPGGFNRGLIFVPANNTWHGFKVRPLTGTRKTIIINYVSAEWLNRHELCYPDQPIA